MPSGEGTKECSYTPNQVFYIRSVYVFGVLMWLFVIYILSLLQYDWFVLLLLCVPLLLFTWTWTRIPWFVTDYEKSVFNTNYLSITLLVVLPLFFNLSKLNHDCVALRIVIVAVFFILLTIIDIWTSPVGASVMKHFKSVAATIGVFLLLIAVYIYFTELFCIGPVLCECKDEASCD